MWLWWILYIALAMRDWQLPVTWPIFAGFLGNILLFLIPALLLSFPKDSSSPRRLTISLWLITIGIYWIFAPIYSYLSVNTNRTLVLWYMIPYAWEVPVFGGIFVMIAMRRFRILRARLVQINSATAPNMIDRLRTSLTFYPAWIASIIGFLAFLGYGPIGSAQYRVFGEAPWVEIIKNVISGTTIGLISAGLYFFSVNYLTEPWLQKLPPTKEHLPFSIKNKLTGITGVMILLAFLILAPVAYKYAQRELEQSILDTMRRLPETPIGTHGYIITIDAQGALRSPHPRGFTHINEEHLEPGLIHALMEERYVATTSRRVSNRYIVSTPSNNLRTISIAHESDFLYRLRPLLIALLIVVVVFGTIFALLIALFARGISKPIELLTRAVREMRLHTRPYPLMIRTGDEIEILAAEFNAMAGQLRDYEENLEQKIEERTAQLASVNDELREKSLVLERVLEDVKRVDEELARLNRAKSEFISMASHQLRTPLTAIKWYGGILRKQLTGKTPAAQRAINHIMNANAHMLDLVSALLNVSRVEMGTLAVEPKEIELAGETKTAMDEVRPLAKERGISLFFENPAQIKATLDPKLFNMILNNALTNAIRYTPSGGRVTVKLATQRGRVILAIRDTGYGIPKAEQKHVFEKFFRASNVREREPQGTGLGLYLTRAVVETLGGTIRFESAENKGTLITVSLPKIVKSKQGAKGLLPMS